MVTVMHIAETAASFVDCSHALLREYHFKVKEQDARFRRFKIEAR
jgi:hypothetical protein